MFIITAVYHRYFSPQATGSTGSGSSCSRSRHDGAQKGPLWWAGHHRNHHQFSDTKRTSIRRATASGGATSGWILCPKYGETPIRPDPGLREVPRAALAEQARLDRAVDARRRRASSSAVGAGSSSGFFTSTVLLWHSTFLVNSLAHVFGRRAYETDRHEPELADHRARSPAGEGWHNNHHRYPSSARQGFRWWQIDDDLLRPAGRCRRSASSKDLRPVPQRVDRRGSHEAVIRSLCSMSAESSVRIVFLGGLGEIGRNCFCLEVDGRILVVDCGLMFPDADMPGIDLVLPDFTYLRDNADRVEAVLLTHAHEDHAGGIAFLLRDISVPIYGSALSLALARNRIEEAGMLDRTEFITVADGERRRIGPIDCQFIPVTHSVPHGFAIAFFTPAGTIMHTGDFKLDLTPVDGRRTDLALIGELARRDGGVRLLLSDSTNAERPGFTPSESTVGAAMRVAVPRARRQALHRHELRVAPAPRRTGRASGDRARAQGRVRRPVDGTEHHDGARARLHRHSRRTR